MTGVQTCALPISHRALQTLQKEIVPILKGRDGEPIWPFDIVGSISHKDAIAVAAVGKKKRYKGIGVDIEDQTTILSKKEYSLFWYKDRFYTSPLSHMRAQGRRIIVFCR